MSLDAATTREVHDRNQDKAALVLLTLSHSAWTDDLRYVFNNADITSNGDVFAGGQAAVAVPGENAQPGQGRLALSDLDNTLLQQILAVDVDERIGAKLELVLSGSLDTVRMTWDALELRDVQASNGVVTASVRQQEYSDEIYPPRVFTEASFPGARW